MSNFEVYLRKGYFGADVCISLQTCQREPPTYEDLFGANKRLPVGQVDLRSSGFPPLEDLESANEKLGLALDSLRCSIFLGHSLIQVHVLRFPIRSSYLCLFK